MALTLVTDTDSDSVTESETDSVGDCGVVVCFFDGFHLARLN